MAFEKHIYYKNAKIAGRPAKAFNPSNKKLDDDPTKARIMQQDKSTKNVDSRLYSSGVNSQKAVFKRNMNEKKVKLELFLIEGNDNFEGKSVRAQMNEVVYKGTDELKEWFYEMGISNNLPNKWE